jgi:hypothetical protein
MGGLEADAGRMSVAGKSVTVRMNLRGDLRWGLSWALAIAVFFSAYILLVRLFRGRDAFVDAGADAKIIIAAYLASGVLVGIILGLLRRFTDTKGGRAIIGIISGWALFTCIGLASEGWFSAWSAEDWEGVLFLGAVFGLILPPMMMWINRRTPLD